ncbi:hypothetical protein ISN45_Aa07g026880 [Arabidopsis thaliana x Arabidopsis arenosa]|uniref:Uncharacterized protein n=1 Tax=Arabidopsis thaliana x Arabidopsis arenosa TaxID=1240361 RepID=A0A8T1Y949_9BRAS|nr:hypothetical protein ISN45_Aa07g026880 [Arabidopsis thaliana x Arabidopsis arenosa]
MAVFRCAVFLSPSSLLPSYSTGRRVSLKVIRCSSVSIPFSSKSSRRKNYLRPKILRTLNPKPQETVLIGIETPENVPPSDVVSNQDDHVEEELQVLSSSVVSNEVNGKLSKLSPKSVAKYGLWLIGIFVFQTVCAVLFLGDSTKSEKTPEISSGSGQNGERESNVVLLEDLEMNEKIAEIRLMAREARKSEGKQEEDETGIDIEKEIEARLSNMEKRLNSQRKGLAGLRVEPLDESGNDFLKDGKSLMFEKKYKFKAEKPPSSNVKGFGGSKGNDEVISGTEKAGENGSVSESRDGEKNREELQNEAGLSDSEMVSGAAQESELRRPSNEVKKSRKSGNRVGGTPNMEAGSGFGSTSLSGKHGEVRKGKPIRRARENQSEKEKKMWWLKLPYVLRILMRSNIDQDISEGYFTLRTKSMEQNEGQVSHMIAFEDQSDARNFSYLLESVFEDLDDFSADIAPVSTKDLYDEVSSGDKNVIVVRKRQLTLYAGQPFEDVERALRTLIQEQR